MKLDYEKPIFTFYVDESRTLSNEELSQFTKHDMQVIVIYLTKSGSGDRLECVYGGKYHNTTEDLERINKILNEIDNISQSDPNYNADLVGQLEDLQKILNRESRIDDLLE